MSRKKFQLIWITPAFFSLDEAGDLEILVQFPRFRFVRYEPRDGRSTIYRWVLRLGYIEIRRFINDPSA